MNYEEKRVWVGDDRHCQLLQQALDIKSEGHLQNEEIRI